MSEKRFRERQEEVRQTVARLSEAAAQPETDLMRDATIQRFEFTFEVTWKTLKLYLERQGFECSGPRPVLKKAFQASLIPTPEEADVWLRMLDDRNLTSHAYDRILALGIYQRIIADYLPLLQAMAERLASIDWE